MTAWLAFAVLAGVVIVLAILPLSRAGRRPPGRAAVDRAVYRDQLREVELDVARGLLTEADAASARLEIGRRLLAADTPDRHGEGPAAGMGAWAAVLAVLVPAGAVAIYLVHGAPQIPDQPYWARAAERALIGDNGTLDLDKAAATLEARVKQDPTSAEGWLLLARTQAARGRWQDSAAAYHEALALTHQRPDIAAAYGEMLVMAADGMVTPAARDAFVATLAQDDKSAVARYYLALAEAQAGNTQAALDGWQRLLADSPYDAPWVPVVKQRIAETAKAAGVPPPAPPAATPSAPGPSTDDMAAAARMTPEQRAQMIHGMVDRLAASLQEKPDDLDGWLRIGRAYQVLGERDKAVDAFTHAAALKPDDPAILDHEIDAMLGDRDPSEPIPEPALATLKRLEALDPREPRALWYLGLAAAQAHRTDEAKSYWQRLLVVLPADSEEHNTVSSALAALDAGK
jgi:cytochrome c-type biogenesis protein CcmH